MPSLTPQRSTLASGSNPGFYLPVPQTWQQASQQQQKEGCYSEIVHFVFRPGETSGKRNAPPLCQAMPRPSLRRTETSDSARHPGTTLVYFGVAAGFAGV